MKPKLWILLGLTLISTAFAGDTVSNFDALSKIVQEKNLTTVDETAHAQESGQSFDALATLVVKNQATSIDQALSYLPETCLRPILVYHSRSLQAASPDFPRVILPCDDNRLLLAFNGSSEQAGYDTLEMIQYRPEKAAYEMRFIRFPEGDSAKKLEISEANPSKCLGCHRADPRPNWEGYPLWPGVVAGNDSKIMTFTGSATDAKTNSSFMSAIGRRFVVNQASLPRYRRVAKNYYFEDNDFADFGGGFLMDAAARLARKVLENPKLLPYRYAIAFAADCTPSDTGFRSDPYLRDTDDKLAADKQNRLVFTLMDLGIESPPNLKGGGLEESGVIAAIRSIVEGAGQDMSDWSFGFSSTAYSFNTGRNNGFRWQYDEQGLADLGKFLLDPKSDADLIQLRAGHYEYYVYCDALKEKRDSAPSAAASR